MPYGNYSFVIDSSFQPFSMQEMMTPLAMYKDEYEKREAAFEDLVDKSDKFKYLSETLPEGSRARSIYEGYANELSKQADDLAKHGLNINNKKSLMNLKRRYQGEIGQLDRADLAMQEEKKMRRQMASKDPSLLYAVDNLSIDQFLGDNTPNLYNVSGEDLRKEGAQYAQAASGRIYGNTQVQNITKYYQEIAQTQGYTPEVLAAWRQNLESIPEFNQAVNDIMDARGVTGNLTGANYKRARQNVINGIMEGAVYNESKKVENNPGVMTAAQAASNALGWANHKESVRQHDLQLKMAGYDENGVYHPKNDQSLKKAEAVAKAKASGKPGRSGTAYDTRNKDVTMIGAKSGSKYRSQEDDKDPMARPLEDAGNIRSLTAKEYAQLVDAHGNITNEYVRNAVGNGRLSDYEIYIIPAGSTKIDGSGFFFDDSTNEDVYVVKPRESKRSATSNDEVGYASGGDNDIPE